MTNTQARLLAAAVALPAGALFVSTYNLDFTVGIVTLLASGTIFAAECVRYQR